MQKPWWSSVFFIAIFCTASISDTPNTDDQYRVKEDGNTLELKTPFGTKTIFNNDKSFDTSKSYRLVIPLKDLQPTPTPTPSPTNAPGSTEDASTPSPTPSSDEETEDDEADRKPTAEATPTPTPTPSPTPTYDRLAQYVVEANHFYNQHKYFEATEIVEQLLKENPEYTRGWIMKGSLLYVQGHKDLAKKAWEQAQKLDAKNDEIHSYLERYR